ncbi:hypothetical protein [Streptomyces wuyuanensis]|uniref:hypothetical protein n=1 Tax=Streptomyces wuyuanensis TaxID=1196353 RepID=UPI00342B7C57
MALPDTNPCDWIKGPARDYCTEEPGDTPPGPGPGGDGIGLTDGASDHVKDLADDLIKKINALIAPEKGWAPATADSAVYAPFLWLGQHLAVAIFVCVVVVCGLTAWQGSPRLKQMGASTGWTLAAVAGMAAVPGAVMLLNKALSEAFTAAFNSSEATLFNTIRSDLKNGADSGNPLAILIIVSALVVALGFAALVFMTRQLGVLAFVCMAPLVLASLARGGDMTAVKRWAMRLLGLMFAPFALLLVAPFVAFAQGSLVVDAVLLITADIIMLRMIFHGIPYFGPKVAGAARALVERNTSNPLARAVVRAGAPEFHERENTPRGPRTVDAPGRAAHQDRGVLLAAYGIKQAERSPRLTTASAVDGARRDAGRGAQITQARRQARAAVVPNQGPTPRAQAPTAPTAGHQPWPRPQAPNPRPAPNQPRNP